MCSLLTGQKLHWEYAGSITNPVNHDFVAVTVLSTTQQSQLKHHWITSREETSPFLCGPDRNGGVRPVWLGCSPSMLTCVAARICSEQRADGLAHISVKGQQQETASEWFGSCRIRAEQVITPFSPPPWCVWFYLPVISSLSSCLCQTELCLSFPFLAIQQLLHISHQLCKLLLCRSSVDPSYICLVMTWAGQREPFKTIAHRGSTEWQNILLDSLISFLLAFNYPFTFLTAAVGLAETFLNRKFSSVVILQGPPLCT